MKSPITKLAAAAVIIIAVLVSINQFVDSPDMAGIALADVIENMKKMPWMEVVTTEYPEGEEPVTHHEWYGFVSKKTFVKYSDSVCCFDYANRKQYFYRFSDEVFEVTELPEDSFYGANSAFDLVDEFIQYARDDRFLVTQRKDILNGEDVEIFELSKSYPDVDMKTVAAVFKIELIVNSGNKLLFGGSAKRKLLHKGGKTTTYNFKVTYPESGPSDIYALGVPPTAALPTAYASDKLYEELNEVRQMFAAGDVDGLVTILLQGQFMESKVAAANYLAKVGDLSAVGPLEKLAEEWQGDPADNPFAAAISEIRKRLDEEDNEVTTQITEAEKTITRSGVVLDPNDNPIEGVDIRAELYYNGCYTDWRIFAETTAKVRTNKSGQFKLSTPSAKYGMHYILVFEHPEYPTARYHVTRGYLRIHMLGAEPSFVAGQVIDEDGNVIEGAAVQALVKWHPSYRVGGRGSTVTTYTDSKGWFLFDKLYEGARLHIDAWKEGYLRYSTESIGRDAYPVRAGMDYLLFTLEPGGTIIGHLTCRGKPYRREGILIAARRTGSAANGQAVTDKNGEFKISGLDSKRRYTLTINERFFAGTGLLCKPAENIQVGAGEKSTVALELEAGVPVTFRIIDGNTGRAVYNQFFSAVLWDPNYRETRKPVNIRVAAGRTDASGRCVLMLTPNVYQLHTYEWDAQSERKERLSKYFKVGADSNEVSVEVSITPYPRLYGRLVDTEGEPVEGQVTVLGESAISNIGGEFTLPLPNQTYMSRVSYAFGKDKRIGRAFFCREVIDTNQTEIVLEPLVDIVGRATDPNGKGLADALPKVGILVSEGRWYRERQAWWQTVVDKDGYFIIKGVPVGVPMVVSITPPGAEPDVILGPLQPGEEIDVGNIVVKGEELERLREPADAEWNGTLSGLLTDEYGDPVMGTLVETRIGRRYFRDYTDIDGRYQLTGLPRGEKLKLNIEHRYAPASYDVVCDGNDFDVQLSPGEQK
ncbi:MAG: carboxypeptidase-like regulatory domain-containing protein [Planctomycetota bacterium]